MNGAQPQEDFTALAQLAARISRHLAMNPNDSQARDDYKYVTGKMQGPSGATAAANAADMTDAVGPTTPNKGAAIGAGLLEGMTDIPRGIATMVTHPLQTADAINSMNLGDPETIARIAMALKDPDASIPEKMDAIIRHTPLNLGYGPERNLLDVTGKDFYGTGFGNTPGSVEDQAHAVTNVASLGLLGVNPAGPIRYMANRILPPALRPPILDAFLNKTPGAPTPEPLPDIPPELRVRADVRSALADYQAGRLDRAGLETALDFAKQDQPFTAGRQPGSPAAQFVRPDALPPRSGDVPFAGNQTPSRVAPTVPSDTPTLRPGEAAEPIPGTNGQGIAITGKRATPVPPTSPTILEMQQGKQPLPAVGVDAPPAQPPQPAPDQQPPVAGEQVNPAAQQAAQAKISSDQAAGLRGPGGMPRWSRGALPADALGTTDLASKAAHLKQLLAMPEAQYQAGKGLLPPEIVAQVDQLRQAGATGAHVDALLSKTTQPADVAGTASTMRNPMYAKAAQIAQQVVKNPTLAEKYGYAGMSPEQVTRALQQRMLQAGKIPPLTSLAKFLARLHGG